MAAKRGRPKGSTEDLPRILVTELSKMLSQMGGSGLWNFPGDPKYVLTYPIHQVPHYIKIKILEHPQVKAGLMLYQALLGSLTWWFELDKHDEIAEYATEILKPHWYNVAEGIVMAKCFGYAPFEKIFEIQTWEGKGEAVAYKDIKFLDPSTVMMHVDKNNERYAGFSQPSLNVDKRIKAEKTFWLTHLPKWGLVINKHNPWYGHADIDEGTYVHWYNNMIVWQMFLRYVGKKVNPPIVAYAPTASMKWKKADGTVIEYNLMEFVHEAIQKLHEGSSLTLPYLESDKSGKKKVDVGFLESEKRTEEFLKVLDATSQQLFYSILVPQSIFEKPKETSGSYAMITSQVEMFLEYLKGITIPEAKSQITDQLIAPAVRLQFGDKAPCPDLKTSLQTESIRKILTDLLVVMAKEGKWVADVDEICRELGISKPLMVDPKGSSSRKKGDDHDDRVEGKKDPTRVGEEV